MTTVTTQQLVAQAMVSAMTVSIMASAVGVVIGAAGKFKRWRRIATATAGVILATVLSGVVVAGVIPKHVEFTDVKVVDAYSERRPSAGLLRSTRYTLVVQFPDGRVVELPSSVDAANMVGDTIEVKVVENYLGGYNVYISE